MSVPVTAAIITRNEEKYIGRCLASLTWADEILVVDAESADHTREICLDPAAVWAGKIRVLTRSWSGFRDQRNYCLEAARNDWMLVVDADEECSPELKERISGSP